MTPEREIVKTITAETRKPETIFSATCRDCGWTYERSYFPAVAESAGAEHVRMNGSHTVDVAKETR